MCVCVSAAKADISTGFTLKPDNFQLTNLSKTEVRTLFALWLKVEMSGY